MDPEPTHLARVAPIISLLKWFQTWAVRGSQTNSKRGQDQAEEVYKGRQTYTCHQQGQGLPVQPSSRPIFRVLNEYLHVTKIFRLDSGQGLREAKGSQAPDTCSGAFSCQVSCWVVACLGLAASWAACGAPREQSRWTPGGQLQHHWPHSDRDEARDCDPLPKILCFKFKTLKLLCYCCVLPIAGPSYSTLMAWSLGQ